MRQSMKELSVEVITTENLHFPCVATQPSQQECPELKSSRCSLRRRRSRKRGIGGNLLHIPCPDDDFDVYQCHPFSDNSVPCSDNLVSRWKGYGAKLSHTLPLLVYERELFGNRGRLQISRFHPWQTRIQKKVQTTCDPPPSVWRSYITQSFKFHQLGTSVGDAVLGLDPTGSFLVALGEEQAGKREDWNELEHGLHEHDYKQLLMLRFYALPRKDSAYRTKALQLLSIPLMESCSFYSNGTGEALGSSWMYNPVRIPVRVWLCTDGRLGACMYRTSTSSRNQSANIVLFPLPRKMTHSDKTFSFHYLSHVHVPCQAKQDLSPSADCNLLVRTSFFPNRDSSVYEGQSWLCSNITEGIPSYLFLVDEEDGFRLTWITESSWHVSRCLTNPVECLWSSTNQMNCATKQQPKHSSLVRSRTDSSIVVQVSDIDAGWVVLKSDPLVKNSPRNAVRSCSDPSFNIAFTGFLSAASLLKDILVRRPHLVTPQFSDAKATLPIFTYHLVQVSMGRIAEVLLIFSVGSIGKGCLGVFVEVDLLTQDYREIEWLRHGSSDAPPASCGNLAFSRHKKSCISHSASVSKVSMDSLLEDMYPDCVTMDNLAVRIQVPVKSMCSRSAPVQIVYC